MAGGSSRKSRKRAPGSPVLAQAKIKLPKLLLKADASGKISVTRINDPPTEERTRDQSSKNTPSGSSDKKPKKENQSKKENHSSGVKASISTTSTTAIASGADLVEGPEKQKKPKKPSSAAEKLITPLASTSRNGHVKGEERSEKRKSDKKSLEINEKVRVEEESFIALSASTSHISAELKPNDSPPKERPAQTARSAQMSARRKQLREQKKAEQLASEKLKAEQLANEQLKAELADAVLLPPPPPPPILEPVEGQKLAPDASSPIAPSRSQEIGTATAKLDAMQAYASTDDEHYYTPTTAITASHDDSTPTVHPAGTDSLSTPISPLNTDAFFTPGTTGYIGPVFKFTAARKQGEANGVAQGAKPPFTKDSTLNGGSATRTPSVTIIADLRKDLHKRKLDSAKSTVNKGADASTPLARVTTKPARSEIDLAKSGRSALDVARQKLHADRLKKPNTDLSIPKPTPPQRHGHSVLDMLLPDPEDEAKKKERKELAEKRAELERQKALEAKKLKEQESRATAERMREATKIEIEKMRLSDRRKRDTHPVFQESCFYDACDIVDACAKLWGDAIPSEWLEGHEDYEESVDSGDENNKQ
ncbi:unnamed protein product, partial [Mesorhabditis spiculigera]